MENEEIIKEEKIFKEIKIFLKEWMEGDISSGDTPDYLIAFYEKLNLENWNPDGR